MNTTKVDYTISKQRVGSRHNVTGEKIVKCPECGKKARSYSFDSASGEYRIHEYVHIETIIVIAGIGMRTGTKTCTVREEI